MDGQLEHDAQDGNAWQEAVDESGRVFYHNPATAETTWDKPAVAFVIGTYSNFPSMEMHDMLSSFPIS